MTAAARAYVQTQSERQDDLVQRHGWEQGARDRAASGEGSESSQGSRAGGAGGRGRGTPADGERFAVCKSTLFCDTRWVERVGHHQVPENELELEWVNGYHGHDEYVWLTDPDKPELTSEAGRANLYFVADAAGTVDGRFVAFFVSAVAVVMDVSARRQYFFKEHDGEISAMAADRSRRLLATGQLTSHGSRSPPVFVWRPAAVVANSRDATVQGRRRPKEREWEAKLAGFCEQRIGQLAFSDDGSYLMAIGTDASHRFACYDWRAQTILFSGMAGNSILMMITTLPHGFAVCGNKEIKVWEHPALGSSATFEKDGSRWMCGLDPLGPVLVECIVAIDDPGSACQASIVCGWPDGRILLCAQSQEDDTFEWVLKKEASRFWQAHAAAITCLAYARPGACVLSQYLATPRCAPYAGCPL